MPLLATRTRARTTVWHGLVVATEEAPDWEDEEEPEPEKQAQVQQYLPLTRRRLEGLAPGLQAEAEVEAAEVAEVVKRKK